MNLKLFLSLITLILVPLRGMDPFYVAIQAEDLEEVKTFLQDPSIDVDARFGLGNLGLAIASWKNVEILKLLLEDPRVDVNRAINIRCCHLITYAVIGLNVESLRLSLNFLMQKLDEMHNPALMEFVEYDLRKALKTMELRMLNSLNVLKELHLFAKKYPNEFPWLEKEINKCMNRALVIQHSFIKKELFEEIMKYQRTMR